MLSIPTARARVFFIKDTTDTTNVTSLRGAVIAANKRGGNNTIFLIRPPGLSRNQTWIYPLTITGVDEDEAQTGDLDITNNRLTIACLFSNVTIDATGLGDRVFQVLPKAQLTLVNLTITGGDARGRTVHNALSGTCGGGIYNDGTLILEHCVITNNQGGSEISENNYYITSGNGGGIYNAGILMVNNSRIVGNAVGLGYALDGGGQGGGIANSGNCILTGSIISKNQSSVDRGEGYGGGIFNRGEMHLNKCVISENFCGDGRNGGVVTDGETAFYGGDSGGEGGGIYNRGQMKIEFSSVCRNRTGNGGSGPTFTGNFAFAPNAGNGWAGAGIRNDGTLNINSTTISGNVCGDGGAGAKMLSTRPPWGGFAEGGSGGSGGGIANFFGSLDLTSCTIVSNKTGMGGSAGDGTSNPTSGGPGGNGGGIFNYEGYLTTVRNSLIALNSINSGGTGDNDFPPAPGTPDPNSGPDGVGPDVAGHIVSENFNLIGIADGSIGLTNSLNSDQVGRIATPIDPLIGPLQMNGGLTPTHAVFHGSPAIDQGNSFGLHTDQRGQPRPHNFSAIHNAGDGSDIGASELEK